MKGRPRKPTHLHILNGNPGKRKHNPDEPQPETGIPAKPGHISAVVANAWDAIAAKLDEIGVLTLADGWALEQLAENYAEILAWREIVDNSSRIIEVETKFGTNTVVHPACKALADAEKRFRAMMVEFGLTPSSRSRVNARTKEKDQADPAEKYFGKKTS